MIISFLYILLAVFGLSVLIFFHELGHYYMARRVGMRVETFAIGFGKPVYSWERDGVKWQIGWLLFGGYVKIAGQDMDDTRNPYEISDGFFGKSPIDRIKVAFAGPFVNLVLAFLIFTVIWAMGGREKNYSEFTHKIGWVDPQSELYASGIRPGDEIISYNNQFFQSSKDHLYAPMTSSGDLEIKGNKVDYTTGTKVPFEYKIKPYANPNFIEKGILTSGVSSPANFLIYDRLPNGQDNPLPEGSPMAHSGIQYGDRIVWVDGNIVFSGLELSNLLNHDKVILTILRGDKYLLIRVPRVQVQELKMEHEIKEELTDWQYEAELNSIKFQNLYTIPYNLTNKGIVENELKFIDKKNELEAFPQHLSSSLDTPLLAKDKIVAIDGKPIKSSYELLKRIQEHRVNMIVERNKKVTGVVSWANADQLYDQSINYSDIRKIVDSIGTNNPVKIAGNYILLEPVAPKTRNNFELSPEKQEMVANEMLEKRKEIEGIEDPEKRAHALSLLTQQQKLLALGVGVQDLRVNYNPTPVEQFETVFAEIWRTLTALVTGSLNPKWISGPIGIVQVVHDNSMLGIKEALFWLGAISLNLGMLNLLPIPVLDGGTIMISLFELVTGKKTSPKTLERLILPFAVLLIGFFIFLTYQDVSRLFGRFFH